MIVKLNFQNFKNYGCRFAVTQCIIGNKVADPGFLRGRQPQRRMPKEDANLFEFSRNTQSWQC